MKLEELVKELCNVRTEGSLSRSVTGISEDSRDCCPGMIFVAVKGSKDDGHRYIEDAYRSGTRIFVLSEPVFMEDATFIYSEDTRKTLAELSAAYYGHPERDMTVIGITGTKGKTGTGIYLYEMLKASGGGVMFIGTVGVMCTALTDDQLSPFSSIKNTTPQAPLIYRLLSIAREGGVGSVILEVSSQALAQGRVFGIPFYLAIFTSFSLDHVGEFEHCSREDYYLAKESLFRDYNVKLGIAMSQDYYAKRAVSLVRRHILCGSDGDCEYRTDGFFSIPEGVGFHLFGESFILSVPGKHNGENALLALAAACELTGKEPSFFKAVLLKTKLPGRLELYRLNGKNVMIDFAHNEASIEAVCRCAREFTVGRIILVFGSVGGRAVYRRSMLAMAAERCADLSIITSDDPDFESAEEICQEIYRSFENKRRAIIVTDRGMAINTALSLAEAGDTVILAGKGGEEHQLVRGERLPFSERSIILSLGAKRTL